MKASRRDHVIPKLRSVLTEWSGQKITITQTYLASISGVEEGYLKQIETNKRPITKKVARSISEATGISDNWLLAGDPLAPMTNIKGLPYLYENFRKASTLVEKNIDSDPSATHYLAFQYAVRVERMIFILGKKGKDSLIRFPLDRELTKLEKNFGINTMNTEEGVNDSKWIDDGTDWEGAAENFSERWIEARDAFYQSAKGINR